MTKADTKGGLALANSSKAESQDARTRRFLLLLLIPIVFIFLFTDDQSLSDSQLLSFSCSIPYVSIISVLVVLLIVLFRAITQKVRIPLDPIAWSLFLRVPLLLVPLFFTDDLNGYVGNYFAVLICPLVYVISRSLDIDTRHVIIAVSLFCGLILSAQIIINAWNIVRELGIQGYSKNRIEVPVGKSNTLASFLLFFFFSLQYVLPKGWKKSLVLLLLLIGLLLTRSNGGMLVFAVVLVLGLFLPGKSKVTKISGGSALIVLVLVTGIVLELYSMGFLDRYVDMIQSIGKESLDVITNGRIGLYEYSFNKFLRHPILGNGLGFPDTSISKYDTLRPHNVILEALTQGGMSNLVLLGTAVYAAIHELCGFARLDSVVSGVLMASIALLLDGMVEPTLFSYQFDFFFWMYMGLGVTRVSELASTRKVLQMEKLE